MGIGAAASEPGTLSVIRQLYPQRATRARALGAWSALAGYSAMTAGTALRLTPGSTQPQVLFTGEQPFGIALDATYLYVSTVGTDNSDGTVVRLPKDGSGAPFVMANGLSWPSELTVDDVGYRDDGIIHVTARFGFQDAQHVPSLITAAEKLSDEIDLNSETTYYFLSRITITPSEGDGAMSAWRKKLFMLMARNAASPIDHFGLPANRTVIMGSQVEL